MYGGDSFFLSLVALAVIIAMLWGWLSAPDAFVANVIGHDQVAIGAQGYNAITLVLERAAAALHWAWVRSATEIVRSHHQPLMLLGKLATAYLVRRRTFMQRLLVTQLAVELFAGRWDLQYAAWLAPIVVLSNQWGMIPWFLLTAAQMVLTYFTWSVSGLLRDEFLRATLVIGVLPWLLVLAWYAENIRGKGDRFCHSLFTAEENPSIRNEIESSLSQST
jgi:hypothetical protein